MGSKLNHSIGCASGFQVVVRSNSFLFFHQNFSPYVADGIFSGVCIAFVMKKSIPSATAEDVKASKSMFLIFCEMCVDAALYISQADWTACMMMQGIRYTPAVGSGSLGSLTERSNWLNLCHSLYIYGLNVAHPQNYPYSIGVFFHVR